MHQTTVEEIIALRRINQAERYYMAGLLSYREYLDWRRDQVLVTDEAHEQETEWKNLNVRLGN